jgi:hypothetical protein
MRNEDRMRRLTEQQKKPTNTGTSIQDIHWLMKHLQGKEFSSPLSFTKGQGHKLAWKSRAWD